MRTKRELRNEILQIRDSLTSEERLRKNQQIVKRVIEQKAFQEADKLLLFASYKSEVDTAEIFNAAQGLNKDLYYPKVVDKEMEFYRICCEDELLKGYRGIREPEINVDRRFILNLQEKILVIMPGAVFDEDGNRIGYGGGYYDKYLQQLETKIEKENICKMAIAFECQMVKTGVIETEAHDVKLDYIITEDRIVLPNPANTNL